MTSPVPPAAPEGVAPLPYDDAALERARAMAKKYGQYVSLDGVHLARLLATIDALTARANTATVAADLMRADRDGLRSAMDADDARLLAASEKVGRPPMGCDTADDLADAILGLREERDEARKSYVALSDYFKTALADRDEARALLWECRDLFMNGPAFADLRARIDTALSTQRGEG